MKIPLKSLLKNLVPDSKIPDILVAGLCSDSRQLKDGEVFFAYPGLKTDGRNFLRQIQHKNVAAIVCERRGLEPYYETLAKFHETPVIPLHDVQAKLSEIAARFYDHPSRAMTVIGVTGTNGKTSCTHFIAQILTQMGVSCAVMGTLGYGILSALKESGFTTQDAISVQRNLNEMRALGVNVVAMEVSSHGLAQHRVDAVEFNMAVFTQLSRDHLDYHETLEAYAAAKERLFQFPSVKKMVVNLDDEMGRRLMEDPGSSMQCIGYSLDNAPAPFKSQSLVIADEIKLLPQGFSVHLKTPWGEGHFKSPLLGRFNLSNLLAVISALALLQRSLPEILLGVQELHTVAGRLESFGGGDCPQVVVDYAHTPDALEKVLTTLREHCLGRLWCLFGCGGDRDRGKRPLMAAIAESFSDHIVLTDDNPRSEPSQQIAREIQQGFSAKAPVEVILDRALAIKYAIQNAAPDDIILVAGKGHEEYQLIGSERLIFSDREQVETELKTRSSNV